MAWVVRTGTNTMKHSRLGTRAGDGGVVAYERACDEPAPTLTTNGSSRWRAVNGVHERRVSLEEASVLQSFRRSYPWQGSATEQHQQVGNAIPPLLAAAVVAPMLVRQEVSA